MQNLENLLNTKSQNYLKEQGITPQKYISYLKSKQYDAAKIIGVIGTLIMSGILTGISASVSFSDPDPSLSFWFRLSFPIIIGGLGIFIGLVALRATLGIKTKFFENAVNESQNFQTLELLRKTEYKYLKKIKADKWQKIREFNSKY